MRKFPSIHFLRHIAKEGSPLFGVCLDLLTFIYYCAGHPIYYLWEDDCLNGFYLEAIKVIIFKIKSTYDKMVLIYLKTYLRNREIPSIGPS